MAGGLCQECQKNPPQAGDYLCVGCRYSKDPPEVREGFARLLDIAAQHAPYGFVAHDNGPWLQIDLCDMQRQTTGLWKHAVYSDDHHRYAVWKETGEIYEVLVSGEVDEDPIHESEWIATLKEFVRQADEDRGFMTREEG